MARGRPRKNIDKEEFEKLCALQCTLEEFCSWFDVCTDTIETWCINTYGKNFSEVFRQKRGKGKISLRRSQFRLAETSASMAIFLGKNYLGQSDNVSVDVGGEIAVDPLSASLKELAREIEDNADK